MANEGRLEEFVRLFTSHEVRLRAFAMSLVVNYADAEDVLQQANLTLWKKFDQFTVGTDFMAWAGRVVYLEVQRHRRAQAKAKVLFGDAFLDAVAGAAAGSELMSELAEREQLLSDCIAKLQPEHRALLRARYDEGMSIERMVDAFNRSGQAVHSVLSRIRRALFDCVSRRLQHSHLREVYHGA
jgi:RNA polymerase sigma-70 factor, ECF subfamily